MSQASSTLTPATLARETVPPMGIPALPEGTIKDLPLAPINILQDMAAKIKQSWSDHEMTFKVSLQHRSNCGYYLAEARRYFQTNSDSGFYVKFIEWVEANTPLKKTVAEECITFYENWDKLPKEVQESNRQKAIAYLRTKKKGERKKKDQADKPAPKDFWVKVVAMVRIPIPENDSYADVEETFDNGKMVIKVGKPTVKLDDDDETISAKVESTTVVKAKPPKGLKKKKGPSTPSPT